jgi:hypothetical protein
MICRLKKQQGVVSPLWTARALASRISLQIEMGQIAQRTIFMSWGKIPRGPRLAPLLARPEVIEIQKYLNLLI